MTSDTGNYQPLGQEPPPPPDTTPFETTPVNPTPSSVDPPEVNEPVVEPVEETGTVSPTVYSVSSDPTYLGPEEHPAVAGDPVVPVDVHGQTLEQRAMGLLQTIRANGMNQMMSNEIDKLLNYFHGPRPPVE